LREVNELTGALQDAGNRQRLLLGELSHRVKNVLAVVHAVVMRSLSDEQPRSEARELISQRLQALSRAHDILTHSDWSGASLHRIVAGELESFADRAEIDGPDIVLEPAAAQSLALIIHELATNALKHGALSTEKGRVQVTWSIIDKDKPYFRFRWRETDGPVVQPPMRKGFGRTLLETSVSGASDAKPILNYAADGFSYEFEAPLAAIVGTGARSN
jgi:two-component sensor histidine kinase